MISMQGELKQINNQHFMTEESQNLEQEKKDELELKKYAADKYENAINLLSNQIFVYNASVIGLNLFIVKDYMEKMPTFNVWLILFALIFSVVSAVFLLYAYRITLRSLDIHLIKYEEDHIALRKQAMYWNKWVWWLFCAGVGASLFNILLTIIYYLIRRCFTQTYYSHFNLIF